MSSPAQDLQRSARDQVYPTVIAWPDGLDESQIARLVAGTGVIDEVSARLAIRRQPPMILGRFNPAQSAALTSSICRAGGEAFAPSLANLAALGASLKVRDLRIVNGNLEIDLYRGLSTTIQREHVQILVRGSIRPGAGEDSTRRTTQQARDEVDRMTRHSPTYGWAMRRAAHRNLEQFSESESHGHSKTTEVLDLHTSNGSVFQVDGDRFAFSILGTMRGHTDRVNMDRLMELLSHISPDEVVDECFPLFRPPPGHHGLVQIVPELRRGGEDPAFAFYSRWAALMYRHVLRV